MRYQVFYMAVLITIVGMTFGIACSYAGSTSILKTSLVGPGTSEGPDNMQTLGPGAGGYPGGVPRPYGGGSGASDVTGGAGASKPTDPRIADALAGIRDYEVTYDKSKSREENTPEELKKLNVIYAGDESPVAKRTKAIKSLDLLNTLADRYKIVEEKWGADVDKDFAPDKPETLNYFQPREDPFAITDQIPDELRPEVSGTGLEGSVDPELLEQLLGAQYQANLRYLPIIIIGTVDIGKTSIVMFTFPGLGATLTLQEGQTRCIGYNPPFSITATQISKDYVVMTLIGMHDRRCRFPATGPVIRTFHINRG